MSSHPSILLLVTAAIVLAATTAHAQRVGGGAGAFLDRSETAADAAFGGTAVPFPGVDEALFGNSAALSSLPGPIAMVSTSFLPAGQGYAAAGGALPIGTYAGASLSVTSYTLGEYAGYSSDDRPLGTFSSRDISISAGGALAIGPGSIGATIHYLDAGLSGDLAGLTGGSGYAVDLSGTIAFEERYYFGLALNNIAGEMSYAAGGRETIPWNIRLGAAWLLPFEERSVRERSDPSGLQLERRLPPRSYLLIAGEGRTSEIDSSISLSAAVEWAPFVELPIGLRLGASSSGDLAFGFFYALPVEFTKALRINLAIRRDYEVGEVSQHISLIAAF